MGGEDFRTGSGKVSGKRKLRSEKIYDVKARDPGPKILYEGEFGFEILVPNSFATPVHQLRSYVHTNDHSFLSFVFIRDRKEKWFEKI